MSYDGRNSRSYGDRYSQYSSSYNDRRRDNGYGHPHHNDQYNRSRTQATDNRKAANLELAIFEKVDNDPSFEGFGNWERTKVRKYKESKAYKDKQRLKVAGETASAPVPPITVPATTPPSLTGAEIPVLLPLTGLPVSQSADPSPLKETQHHDALSKHHVYYAGLAADY